MDRERIGRNLTRNGVAAVVGAAALLVSQVGVVSAAHMPDHVEGPGKMGELERKVDLLEHRTISETLDLHLYGFVDVAYTHNFNNPASGVNSQRIFDTDSNAFRVHLAQIVLEKMAKRGGQLADNFGFRVKLNFGPDSQFTGGTSFDDEVDFQETYAQYIAPIGNGIDFRVGRMNTLIGYEVIESPYNDNHSRSWMFGLGQPFTTTGVRAAYDFTEQLSFAIGGISSFTEQTGDTNSDLSIESALTYRPSDRIGLTGYFFWGDERSRRSAGAGEGILVGGIGTVKFTDQTKMVVESYYANFPNASSFSASANSRWNGVATYLIHDFTEQWGIRIRGEIFEDAGAARTCLGSMGTSSADTDNPPPPKVGVCPVLANGLGQFGARNAPGSMVPAGVLSPTDQTLWEVTFTLAYRPIPSVLGRLEFRYDKSNQNTFQRGTTAVSHQETLSAEVVYLF